MQRRTVVFLAVLFSAVWFANIDYRHLIKTDEGRYAEIAREMAVSGDWVTPRLNGFKYFDKPPLQHWATATAFTLFGANEWTARLWTVLTGLLGVALVYMTGRKLWDHTTGLVAAAVLGASLHWVAMGHVSSLDMGLAFFLALTVCAFAIAQRDDATPAERRNWMLLAWTGAALAVLSKGLIGIVLPGGALITYMVLQRDGLLLRRLHLLGGLALFFLITAPWFVVVGLRNPEFFHFFFVHEHVERFLTKVHGRDGPWWYFIPLLIAGLLPWTLALPALVRIGASNIAARFQPQRLLLVWVAIVFLFFSVSSSKLPSYTLPILPALALLAARALLRASSKALIWQWGPFAALGTAIAVSAPFIVPRQGNADTPTMLYVNYAPWIAAGGALLALGCVVGIVLARSNRRLPGIIATAAGGLAFAQCIISGHEALSPVFSAYHIAEKIKPALRPDTRIFAVDTYDHTLPFYLGRTMTMVAYQDELAAGIRAEPDKFLPDYESFERAWAAAPTAFALMNPREFDTFAKRNLPMIVAARDPRRVIVRKP